MKHTLLLLFLSVILVFPAWSEEKNQILFENLSEKFVLKSEFIQNDLAFNDRIVALNNDLEKAIFISEGRKIEKTIFADFDKDGKFEIFIQMDLGGSGGYKEFVLLQKHNSSYKSIWEYSGFAGAKTRLIKDKNLIQIEYFDDETSIKKQKTVSLGWRDNQLIQLD
jgi:hypothetical protein